MKLRFLATGNAPTHYSFNGDVVTAHHDGKSESFDLSALQHGDQLEGVGVDDLSLSPGHIMRHAERDSEGELHLTLCQQVGPQKWVEGVEFDVTEYDPAKIQVIYEPTDAHVGKPWVVTSGGKQWV